MKSLNSKNIIQRLLLSLLFSTGFASAQSLKVDYYGVVSSSSDANMLKMAQDVFFTQLKSIDDINVDDKRPDLSHTLSAIPEFEGNSGKLAFYAEITEEKSEGQSGWNCKFNVVTPADGITHSKSEIFESYYKILVNAKTAIEAVLEDLKAPAPGFEDADKNNIAMDFVSGIDIESLAGTWTGEPFADKIIILRGGRGFIIYKNGATMNIKLSVSNQNTDKTASSLEIKQIGKTNASYYPDLPREKALSYAANASPITWKFTISSSDTLEGSKSTLVASADDVKEGTVTARWTRK